MRTSPEMPGYSGMLAVIVSSPQGPVIKSHQNHVLSAYIFTKAAYKINTVILPKTDSQKSMSVNR